VRTVLRQIVLRRCSRCGVEQLTWPRVSECSLCGGPFEVISDKESSNLSPLKITSPLCLRCGGPLEEAEFAEEWGLTGKLVRTERDLVCRRCKVRWIDMDLATEEEISNSAIT
jgi:hypothetical protein